LTCGRLARFGKEQKIRSDLDLVAAQLKTGIQADTDNSASRRVLIRVVK
jgi:hypothetical protein